MPHSSASHSFNQSKLIDLRNLRAKVRRITTSRQRDFLTYISEPLIATYINMHAYTYTHTQIRNTCVCIICVCCVCVPTSPSLFNAY